MFRPDSEPLTPNWKHLPIGYHGRAGTVAVSGTPVVRPVRASARRRPTTRPTFGPSQRLDIEAEVGFVVGTPSHARRARCRWATSPTTSSASAWSTTGPPATCRPGSTCRSARSSASPSSPRCRRGSCRWPRWRPPGCARRRGTSAPLPYLRRRRRTLGPRHHPGGPAQRRAGQPPAVRAACTGPPPSSSPT